LCWGGGVVVDARVLAGGGCQCSSDTGRGWWVLAKLGLVLVLGSLLPYAESVFVSRVFLLLSWL
jgi:hypothetical protein